MFTSDQGDMLADHYLLAKRKFYEGSAIIPMIIMGERGNRRVVHQIRNVKLTAHGNVMPTLHDL